MLNKLSLFCCAFGLILSAYGYEDNSQARFTPMFSMGLNQKQIMDCEAQIAQQCPMEMQEARESCIKEKFYNKRFCTQALTIRSLTGLPANEVRNYAKVSVVSVLHKADNLMSYYIVTYKGVFITLRDNSHINLRSSPQFAEVLSSYPDAVLTDLAMDFPSEKSLQNGGVQLIFQQVVKSGPFVSSADVATADIAYEFTPEGEYSNVALMQLQAMNRQGNK